MEKCDYLPPEGLNTYIPPRPMEQYARPTYEELRAALKEHSKAAAHVRLKVDINNPEPRYFAEYKIIPMVLDAESKAYANEILAWAEKHGYDVAFMDEEKVRDICERMQPVEPVPCLPKGTIVCGACFEPLLSHTYNYCPFCGKKIQKENEK